MQNGKVVVAGRGGESFQVGYDAGYAQCRLDISNEPPSTEEMKWLRKLRYAMTLGVAQFHVDYVAPEYQTAMDEYAQRSAADYAELQTSRYIKSLEDEIERLKQSAPVWTACSDGLPEGEGEFDVTVFIIENGERRYVSTTATYDPMDDEDEWCQIQYPGGVVVAWKELSEPYNPDHFRDATKMIAEGDT